jgi:hypothetical protein
VVRSGRLARPPELDRETFKRRNVVERSFNLLKQWRGLATRYDKHAVTCRRNRTRSQIADVLSEDEIGLRDDERAELLALNTRMDMGDRVPHALAFCPPLP